MTIAAGAGATVAPWLPKVWETQVKRWLVLRHGGCGFVPIPDQTQGDLGLEGFSRDGVAYQCYVADGAPSARELYMKQRDKLTKDIGKFIANAGPLLGLLGPTRIHRWVLAVPRVSNKDLLAHAESKAGEVRKKNLPHVDPNRFFVHVETEEAFATERDRLVAMQAAILNLPISPVPPERVGEWAASQDEGVKKLDGKVTRILPTAEDEQRRELRTAFIREMIARDNLQSEMRGRYPELWEQVEECIATQESGLLIASYASGGAPATVLQDSMRSFDAALQQRLPGVGADTRARIVRGTVADWLIRCPLKFL